MGTEELPFPSFPAHQRSQAVSHQNQVNILLMVSPKPTISHTMTEHEGTYNKFHSWHSVMCSDVWLKRYKEEDSVILGSYTTPRFNNSLVFWVNTIPLPSKAKMSWNIRLCLPTDPASLRKWMEASATPVQCYRKIKFPWYKLLYYLVFWIQYMCVCGVC
jgi:hypothetical protein